MLNFGDLVVTHTRACGRVVKVMEGGFYSIQLYANMSWGWVETQQRRMIAHSEIAAFKAGTASAVETAPAAA